MPYGLKGKLGLTSTMPHPTPLNRPSFVSHLRNLHDDATYTTRGHSFTSFEAKLGNTSLTCFPMKQITGCRRMSSHHLHPNISFSAQTSKPRPTWFWGPNQEIVMMILWAQSPNHGCQFWGPNQETRVSGFEAKAQEPQPPVLKPNQEKPSTLVLRLNQETRAPRLLVHNGHCT
jgi:hypothetical protein